MKLFYQLTILFLCAWPITLVAQKSSAPSDNFTNQIAPSEEENQILAPMKLEGNDLDDFVVIPADPKNNQGGNGLSVQAVPANNNCANAIGLVVDDPCISGTTKESDTQSGEFFACQGSPNQSVWYKFVATSARMFVEIERTASSGCYLSSAVYAGSCLPNTTLSCEDASFGPNVNILNVTGLTINNTYLVQVSYKKGSFCGSNNNVNSGADFCIRVGNTQDCSACNNTCGVLCIYATQPTVAQVVSNCQSYPLASRINAGQSKKQCYTFTAVAASFSLQMIINSTGCSGGNVSSFDWTLFSGGCVTPIQSGNLANLNAAGLSIGTNYTLCYEWTATCLHNIVYPYIVATSPLPISLLYFEGAQEEQQINLEWITATEKNNNYFSVQRSNDGTEFEELARIDGAGNSNSILKYSYLDEKPKPGLNYYRLVQYDFDNSSSTSKIVAVRFDAKAHFTILQNPIGESAEIEIYSDNEMEVLFEFMSAQGQTISSVKKIINQGEQRIIIPTESLSKGAFFIKINYLSTTKWLRVVKI